MNEDYFTPEDAAKLTSIVKTVADVVAPAIAQVIPTRDYRKELWNSVFVQAFGSNHRQPGNCADSALVEFDRTFKS